MKSDWDEDPHLADISAKTIEPMIYRSAIYGPLNFIHCHFHYCWAFKPGMGIHVLFSQQKKRYMSSSLFLSLPICLSVSLSLCLLCLSFSVHLSICLYFFIFFHTIISVSLSLSIYLSIYLSIIDLSFYSYIAINLSIYLFAYTYISYRWS